MPYANPARLVLLVDSSDPDDGGFLYKDFVAIRSLSRTLEDIAAYYRDSGFFLGSRSLVEENLNPYKVPL